MTYCCFFVNTMIKIIMFLKDYLKTNNISQNRFAKKCGVDKSSMSRIVQGKRFPRPEILNRIELATDGEVKANDFMKEAQLNMVGK